MNLLIISAFNDLHAHAVKWAAPRYGAKADIFCASDFPQRSRGTFDAGTGRFELSGPAMRALDYDVVWGRRLGNIVTGEELHPADEPIARQTGRGFLRSFYDCFRRATWVNDPDAADAMERKVSQLAIAQRAGILLPETIISNDPDRVRAFVSKDFACVAKSLRPMTWRTGGDKIVLTTSRLDIGDLWDEVSISSCPMIYQQEIIKEIEYRVVVFGREVVCYKIDSQSILGAKLDWRGVPPDHLPISLVECPEDVRNAAQTFMNEANIVHGSFDFIRGVDRKLYFLEVNQQGQFLWLEKMSGQGALLDIATQFLAQGGLRDFAYDSPAAPVTFADYIATGRADTDLERAGQRHIADVEQMEIYEDLVGALA